MTRHRLWVLIRRVWVTLGLSATAVFVVWSLIAYRASGDAHAAARTDARVDVSRQPSGIWYFKPLQPTATKPVGLVFFPGALVDPTAYAPITRLVAEQGYPSFIVELPKRGAFGGAESGELSARVRATLRDERLPKTWVAAGHSRGAVVASTVASESHPGLSGLVFIGTSHPRDVDLSKLTIPVGKIVGTRDGLASPDEVEANMPKLPPSTHWTWVDGGNHSQFGWYGFQPGDRRATISADSQRGVMMRAVLDVMREVERNAAGSVQGTLPLR